MGCVCVVESALSGLAKTTTIDDGTLLAQTDRQTDRQRSAAVLFGFGVPLGWERFV